MSIGNAIVNQALGAASRQATGALKKVMGNLPGSVLGGSKPAFGISANMPKSINLQYPLNVEGDIQQGHYIMFFINSSNPTVIAKDKESAYYSAMWGGDDPVFGSNTQLNPPKVSTYQTAPTGALSIKRPATTRLEKAISLYMPTTVKTEYKMNYTDTEIGGGAQAAASLLQSAIDSGRKGTMFEDFITNDGYKSGAQTLGAGAAVTAVNWAKGIEQVGGPLLGMQGSIAAASIASGKIMSDKMELLFTGVNRRQFSYTFTFIPKSEEESEMVANIVFTFKKYMTPSFGELNGLGVKTTAAGRILNIPETFDIQYMYHAKENPWLNKISTCYLLGMDVSYGSEKSGFFEPLENPAVKGIGPPPAHTSITLNFEEIEKMSRERIEQGF